MNYRCLLLILYLLPVIQVEGQSLSENNFDYYSTSSGLSNNNVSAVAQDPTGYLWIATSHGLNRFNGSRFVQFHSNTDSSSMSAEDIPGMTWLDSNRLAVYTVGLFIINTKTGTTKNIFIPYHNSQY